MTGVLVVGSHGAHAQSDEADYFADLPVVLSASRLPQALDEAPGAVTVIDRELIRATGYRDLARLLRLVPGIQSSQIRGGRTWTSYHGLSPATPAGIQVLLDGRSVISQASYDGVDWKALPVSIDEIERIEVVRGPNPVSFGANAFMGAINIITRDSAADRGSRVRVNAGDPGILDLALSGNGMIGQAALRLDAALTQDDGFDDLHDQSRVGMVAARADWRPSNADQVVFRLGASSIIKGEGYAGSVFSSNAERDSHSRYASGHLEWTHATGPGSEWRVDAYRNWEKMTDSWSMATPAFAGVPASQDAPVNRDRTSTRDNLEFHHRFVLGERARVIWGGEIRVDRVRAPFLFAEERPKTSVMRRVFADGEWKFAPAWQLTLGGAAEQELGASVHFSPRAFLNWRTSEDHAWRIGYSTVRQQMAIFWRDVDVRIADRASGVLLAHAYMPNPAIGQARFASAEIGYFGRLRGLGMTLDGRVFRERATDFAYPVSVASPLAPALAGLATTTQFQNYRSAVVLTGLEYEVKARPWKDTELRLAHTLIHRDSGDWIIDHQIAPYMASLSWIQGYRGGWSSTVTAFRMGPTIGSDVANASAASLTKDYTTIDARLAYAFRRDGRSWEASINAINLGGRHAELAGRRAPATTGQTVGYASPMIYLAISGEL